MRWKTTVFLLVATIGVGAYVSLYEIRQPDFEQREQRAKQVAAITTSAVTKIVLDFPLTNALTLTQGPTGWQLWSPPGKPGAPLTTLRLGGGDTLSEGPPAKAGARVEGSPGDPASGPQPSAADRTAEQQRAGGRDVAPSETGMLASGAGSAGLHMRADESRITALLNHLAPLTSLRTLTPTAEHPLTLKEFGLDPPAGQLTIEAAGQPALTVLFGEVTAVGGARYLKRANRPEVFVVPPTLFDDANQFPDTFRDPMMLPIAAGTVQTLTVRTPSGTYTLAHHDATWRVSAPVEPAGAGATAGEILSESRQGETSRGMEDLAERSTAEALAKTLAGMRIKRFVDDNPQVELIPTWGLDHPTAEVTVQLNAGAPPITLFFGKAIAEDRTLLYAKRSDEPRIYGVSQEDANAFVKSLEEVRAKGCFTVTLAQVNKLSISHAGSGWTIAKADGQWQDEQEATALDTPKVEDLIHELEALTLTSFVEPREQHPRPDGGVDSTGAAAADGLESPQGVISLWSADQPESPQQLLIGAVVEGSAERYVKLTPRQVIGTMSGSVIGMLGKTAAQLKPDQPLHPAPPPSTAPSATPAPAAGSPGK